VPGWWRAGLAAGRDPAAGGALRRVVRSPTRVGLLRLRGPG